MSVQVTQNATPMTLDDIRAFMRDRPGYNILLDEVEFTDVDIDRAMRFTVMKWNALPPVTNLPGPEYINGWVLLCGVCGILLRSEGLRQVRNQLRTQDGNIAPVGIDDKEELYMRWSLMFSQEFEALARSAKMQQNMESILGSGPGVENGLSSGYRYIGKYTS